MGRGNGARPKIKLLRKLCYIGPSWRQLHEGYAKNGLVDKNAAVCAVREIVIPGSPDQVWAVITDMKNWPAIRSDIHEVEIQGPVAAEVTFARAHAGRRLTSPSRSASRIAASSTRQLAGFTARIDTISKISVTGVRGWLSRSLWRHP
jgi:hypothetical protein